MNSFNIIVFKDLGISNAAFGKLRLTFSLIFLGLAIYECIHWAKSHNEENRITAEQAADWKSMVKFQDGYNPKTQPLWFYEREMQTYVRHRKIANDLYNEANLREVRA